jgi:hypothetical protein
MIGIACIAGACAGFYLLRFKLDGSQPVFRKILKIIVNLLIFITMLGLGFVWVMYMLHNAALVLMADLCWAFQTIATGGTTVPTSASRSVELVLPCLDSSLFNSPVSLTVTFRDLSLGFLNNITSTTAPNNQYTLTTYPAATSDYSQTSIAARVGFVVSAITNYESSRLSWVDLQSCAAFKRVYKALIDTVCIDFLILLESMVSGICTAGVALTIIVFFAAMASHRWDQARFPHDKYWDDSTPAVAKPQAVAMANQSKPSEDPKAGAQQHTSTPIAATPNMQPCPTCKVMLPQGAQFCGTCGQQTKWAPLAVNAQNFPPPK